MTGDKSCMEIVKVVDGVKVMKLSGVFTVDKTADFQQICKTIDKEEDIKAIVLDFSEVEMLDTTAFACMVNAMKENIKQRVKIGMLNLKQKHQYLLNILGMDGAISVYDSEAEAIERLSR